MTLKFEKLIEQVQTMTRAIAHRTEDASQRGQQALDQFLNLDDLPPIFERIDLVRQRDAGYRGAAPHQEAIHIGYPLPQIPEQAIVIATDGSQIYPNAHGTALYYLINVATFVYFHGVDALPQEASDPRLFYTEKDLRERNGHGAVIKNLVVNARRDVEELRELTTALHDNREYDVPILGIRDGRLLWWVGNDVPNGTELEGKYHGMLRKFNELAIDRTAAKLPPTAMIGYVERGDSRFVIRLLHLMNLAPEDVTRKVLETSGDYEGLTDDWLFSQVLNAGERSAIMIQQSPQNKAYKERLGDDYEIAFFYLNVGNAMKSHIVRIELPMWVANNPQAVSTVHSLLVDQCRKIGRYPYALTRADELAVVQSHEKAHLENYINTELLKNKQSVEQSPKEMGKQHARAKRQSYDATWKGQSIR